MINVEEVTLEEAFEIENQARFIWRDLYGGVICKMFHNVLILLSQSDII